MTSENVPGTAGARVPSASEQRNDKRHDKKLELTLEAGHSGGAVVLHCQGRIIFHSEALTLSTIVAEVLPSAHRMVVDLAGIDSVDSGGLGELVLTHMCGGIHTEVCLPQQIGSTSLRSHQPGIGLRCVRQRSRGDGGDGSGRSTVGIGATFPAGSDNGRLCLSPPVPPLSKTLCPRATAWIPGDTPGAACAENADRAPERAPGLHG